MEVIVALAILAILAGATLPVILSAINRTLVDDTADRLQAVRSAIYDPAAGSHAFSQIVGANIGELSQLSTPIVSGDAAVDPNSCGNAFNNGQRNKWPSGGPFVGFVVEPGVGLGTAMGRLDDSVTRIPPTATAGVLRLTMQHAELRLVQLLDEKLNAGDGESAGSVQWVLPAASEETTMYYVVPINNKC